MKYILFLIILFGCQAKKETKYVKGEDPVMDYKVDSMVNNMMLNARLSDTGSAATSPIKILKARPVEKEYSSYKDVSITYKNVSGKKIDAIRFKWYGVNAFNEPADMGIRDGIGSGFDDDKLNTGQSRTSSWSVLSKDLKKVVKAWAYEVVYSDGTKWKSN